MTAGSLDSFPKGGLAVVVGAKGGLGSAMTAEIRESGAFADVWATSRDEPHPLDITHEPDIVRLAGLVARSGLDLRLVFDATGYLHGPMGGPEKSWAAMDLDAMTYQFKTNAIGPALLIKHLLPRLPREGKSVFATISAKVGSISDNQLGGWYGYRASKAALNQIVKTASIELARKRPDALCLALHPGTVATRLSAPFARRGVRIQTAQESAMSLIAVLERATARHTGRLVAYDGEILPF